MSINSEVINDSEVTVSSSIKTSTPTHSEFKEEFREIGIPEDKLPQIFKLESRVSLKDINWGRQSSVSANVETLASSASGVVEVAEEPNSKNNEPVQMDPKFRSEIQVSLSPRKLDEAKTANLPEKKIQALSKPVEELIQILKYDGGLEGVLKSVNTASDQAVKPRDIPTPGIMFKDPIQPDSGRGSNSSASLPPMTVKVYQGEPPIQPLRSSSVCSTLSSESSRPDRQSPLQISTEESLHYSPCPSSMGTSKSDEQSAYNNSRTNTPPKLTSPALIIRDSQKDRFPTMQVKSFEDEYYVRSREGDEFLKTNKYGVLPPAESTSSIHSGTSSGRSAKSPVFMIAGFKSTTESIGYDEEKVQKKQVGTAVEVRSSGNKPAHNGKATVPVNSTPVGPMIGRQEYSSSIRHESTVKPQLSNDDLKLQQEYDKLHKLFTAWQRQLKTNEQLVKQGGKVPEVSLLDFQRLQAQMLAQHEFVQSLCNDAQTTSGSVKSGSLQSVSSGSLNSLSSSPVGEIIMESRTCQVTIAQEQEDPTKVIERQLIAETFAVRNFSKSRSGGVSPEKEPPKPVTTTTDLNGPGSIQKIIAERRATRLANQESSATYQLNANNSVLNGVVSEIDKSSVIRPSQLFKKKSTAEVVTNGHGTNGFAQPMPFTNVVKYDEVPTRSTLPGNRQRSQLPTDSEVVGDTVKQSVLPSVSKLAGVFCSSNDNTQPQNFRQSQNGPTWQQLNCITPNSSTTGGTKPLGWSERQLEQTTFVSTLNMNNYFETSHLKLLSIRLIHCISRKLLRQWWAAIAINQ